MEKHELALVGHPYAPIGMGEHIRCSYRAMRSVALRPTITDIYKLQEPDVDDVTEFGPAASDKSAEVNIFHINADEVEQAMAHLSYHEKRNGYQVIYPAWELAKYPEQWANKLDVFDEVWAPSQFIKDSIEAVCARPVYHMSLACEVMLTSFLSRRYFGIPEGDYTFLFFFDVRSYAERKNPSAVVRAFRRLISMRPYSRARLVLKVNGADLELETMGRLKESFGNASEYVTFLPQLMSDNEVKNLVRCCDCFLSLHRSEGYGRGLAEAMSLAKPTIATAYSGNMDFMSEETSFLVPYKLISVKKDSYPHWENQVWADADDEVATNYMIKLIDYPNIGREVGRRARQYIRAKASYRSAGLRYRDRIKSIRAELSHPMQLTWQ